MKIEKFNDFGSQNESNSTELTYSEEEELENLLERLIEKGLTKDYLIERVTKIIKVYY